MNSVTGDRSGGTTECFVVVSSPLFTLDFTKSNTATTKIRKTVAIEKARVERMSKENRYAKRVFVGFRGLYVH